MEELHEISLLLFFINLFIVVFVAVFISIIPMITRKSLLFGVRIPEEAGQNEEVRKLKAGYIKTVLVGSVVVTALLILQYLLWPDLSLLACMYFPFLLIGLQFAAFIPRWKKAIQLKQEKGWITPIAAMVDTQSAVQREKLIAFPKRWYVISLLIILGTIILSVMVYPSIPDPMVTHWNASMQPDAWSNKSILQVLVMPLIALGTLLIMVVSNIGIYRMKLQISAEHPELSYAQHRMYRKMMSNALGIVTAVICADFTFFQLQTINLYMPSAAVMMLMIVLLLVFCCAPLIYVTLKAGQSGCKLKPPISEMEAHRYQPEKIRTVKSGRGDDRYWKLGMFYYNKDDPAILVEDRFGGNGGFNYAHPVSKVLLLLGVFIVVTYAVITAIYFIH